MTTTLHFIADDQFVDGARKELFVLRDASPPPVGMKVIWLGTTQLPHSIWVVVRCTMIAIPSSTVGEGFARYEVRVKKYDTKITITGGPKEIVP